MIEGGNEGLPIQERKSEKGEQPDMTGAQRDCEETSWKLIVRTCLFDMFGCSIQNLSTSNFCKSVSALIMQIIQAIMNQ